jgi:hypothetical protein
MSLRGCSTLPRRFRKAPRQWRPPVNRAQAIQARQARVELSAAAQTLEQVRGQLDSEVARGLQLVQTLNANTADPITTTVFS